MDEAHLDRVEGEAGGRIRYVLVTHTHPDHAPGAAALAARSRAQLGGYDARDGFVPDLELRDGDVLELGPVRLRALHTPGHASNHLCYLIEQAGTGDSPVQRRLMLSGDHIMGGSTVVISPPDGDMAQYLDSLRRLLDLDPPIEAIAPGHGPILDNPRSEIEALLAHRLAEQAVSAAFEPEGPGDGRRARRGGLPRRGPRQVSHRVRFDVGPSPQAPPGREGWVWRPGGHRGHVGSAGPLK